MEKHEKTNTQTGQKDTIKRQHLCCRPLLLAFDNGSETAAENFCGSQLRNAKLFACSVNLPDSHFFGSFDMVQNLADDENSLGPMFATYLKSRFILGLEQPNGSAKETKEFTLLALLIQPHPSFQPLMLGQVAVPNSYSTNISRLSSLLTQNSIADAFNDHPVHRCKHAI